MAIFTRQEELKKQGNAVDYHGTTGFNKTIMDMATSEYNPLNYVAPVAMQGLAHAVSEGDDRKVMADQWGSAIGQQMAAIDFGVSTAQAITGMGTDVAGLKASGGADKIAGATEATKVAGAQNDLDELTSGMDADTLAAEMDANALIGDDFDTEEEKEAKRLAKKNKSGVASAAGNKLSKFSDKVGNVSNIVGGVAEIGTKMYGLAMGHQTRLDEMKSGRSKLLRRTESMGGNTYT